MEVPNMMQSTVTPAIETTARCPLCGSPLDNPDACSRCDWVRGYDHQSGTVIAIRNPRDAIAAVLSLIWPGLGHLYKGHLKLSMAIVAGGLVCLLWSIMYLMFFGFLILPFYWCWIAIDAYFRRDLKYPQHSPA